MKKQLIPIVLLFLTKIPASLSTEGPVVPLDFGGGGAVRLMHENLAIADATHASLLDLVEQMENEQLQAAIDLSRAEANGIHAAGGGGGIIMPAVPFVDGPLVVAPQFSIYQLQVLDQWKAGKIGPRLWTALDGTNVSLSVTALRAIRDWSGQYQDLISQEKSSFKLQVGTKRQSYSYKY
jgi:hypothetical protein